jgi:hypothetical protein
MPAAGKPFEVFVADDSLCRRFAETQTGIHPQEAATQSTITGAATGATAGAPGLGAAAGAGSGLLLGSAVGASAGYGGASTLQQRYDIAYTQCMYAKGNQVPGVAQIASAPPPSASLPPPPPNYKPVP